MQDAKPYGMGSCRGGLYKRRNAARSRPRASQMMALLPSECATANGVRSTAAIRRPKTADRSRPARPPQPEAPAAVLPQKFSSCLRSSLPPKARCRLSAANAAPRTAGLPKGRRELPSPASQPPPDSSCRCRWRTLRPRGARAEAPWPCRCRAAGRAEPNHPTRSGREQGGGAAAWTPAPGSQEPSAEPWRRATGPPVRAGARRRSRLPSRAEGRTRGPLRLPADAARPRPLTQRAGRRTSGSCPCSRGTWHRGSNSRGTRESSTARG
jgi:hypothetical protein